MTAFPPGSEPRRLQEREEARGELIRVFEAKGQCVAVFSWGAVSLPGELLQEFCELVGHEVAVLRLGRYHVRRVEDA